MKKYGLLFLACLFLFSMWVPATDAVAKNVNALDIKWTKSTNVPLDKRWTISFNKEIHKDSDLVKYVYVENTAGEKIPVEVSINTARTKIYVEPVNAYEPGETYKLIINNGLISSGGKKLKDTVVKEFTTEGEQEESPFVVTYKLENLSSYDTTVKIDKGAYYHLFYDSDDFTSGEANIATDKEVKIYNWGTLYVSYKTMNHQKPIDLKNKITPTIVNDQALNTVILQKGESAEINYVGEYLTNYTPLWAESEHAKDFYLPLRKRGLNYQINLIEPNTTNKIGLEQGTYTITNPNEESLILYAYNKPNVTIKKYKESLNNTYILKPNEVVKISGDLKSEESDYLDIYLESVNNSNPYSYELASYGLDEDKETYNKLIRKKSDKFSRDVIEIENGIGEYIYLKNTSTENILVHENGKNAVYEPILEEPLKKYVLQTNETIRIQEGKRGNLILENTLNETDLAYREMKYNDYGRVLDIQDRIISESQEDLYISGNMEVTNTSGHAINLYVAKNYDSTQKITNKFITKTIKPNEFLKISYMENVESEPIYIKTSSKEANYSIIDNEKMGNIYIANKGEYLLENNIEYGENGQEYYRNEVFDDHYVYEYTDKYIHNTGNSNIQVIVNLSLVKEIGIVQEPNFIFAEKENYDIELEGN